MRNTRPEVVFWTKTSLYGILLLMGFVVALSVVGHLIGGYLLDDHTIGLFVYNDTQWGISFWGYHWTF